MGTVKSMRMQTFFASIVAGFAVAGVSAAAPPGTTTIKLRPGTFPDYPLSAFGAIWIESHRDVFLYRINPKTNKTRRIRLPENQCGPLVAGGGRLWVHNCPGETGVARIYALEPHRDKIVVRRRGGGFAYAGGSLWTIDDPNSLLLRTDPQTGVVLVRVKLGISPAPNGTWPGSECLGSLWTTNGTDGLQRTDLATNTSQVIPLPGGHDATGNGYFAAGIVACAAGKVWVPDGAGLYEVDPTDNSANLLPISIGPFSQQGDVSIVASGNEVYLRTSDTSVAKIDATTGAVIARYPASGGGGGIAVAYGSLWVVNALTDSVWRERL
jgi:streptogramin lyase